MNDDIKELIKEIAGNHGVALEPSDPILILHTATQKIVADALARAEAVQSDALKQHRSELEAATARWQQDSKNMASQFLQQVPTSIAASASTELHKAASAALLQLDHALERHDRILARATIMSALSAAVALLAAATFVWARPLASSRVDASRTEMARIEGPTACN